LLPTPIDSYSTPANGSNASLVGTFLLFAADDGVHGEELWRSDGTYEGTELVKDICPGAFGSQPMYMTAFKGAIYFSADDCDHGHELWRSDGTAEGTTLLVDLRSGREPGRPAFFTLHVDAPQGARSGRGNPGAGPAEDGSQESEFQRAGSVFDGVVPSTWELHDNAQGLALREPPGSVLYFAATDGELAPRGGADRSDSGSGSGGGGWGGLQLWVTDGTAAGTRRAFDQTMNRLDLDVESLDKDWPRQLTSYAGSVFYPANAGTGAAQLPKGFARKHQDQYARVLRERGGQGSGAVLPANTYAAVHYSTLAGDASSSIHYRDGFGGYTSDESGSSHLYDSSNEATEVWPSLSEVSNEDVLRGVDVAFEVSDVDTFPGLLGEIAQPDVTSQADSTSKNSSRTSRSALTLRLSCAKGRFTFGYRLRQDKGASEGRNDGLGHGWDDFAELSLGGTVGYRGGGGGRGRRAVAGLVYTLGSGVNDDYLEVSGSAEALNEALQDLRYRGKDGATGWDTVEVTLSDSPLNVCGGFAAAQDNASDSAASSTTPAGNASASMQWFADVWHAETAQSNVLGSLGFRSGPNPMHQPNWLGGGVPGGDGEGAGWSGLGGRKSPSTDGGGGQSSQTEESGGQNHHSQPDPRLERWGGAANLCDMGTGHTVHASFEVHLSPVNDPPHVEVRMPPPGAPPPPRLLPLEAWPSHLRRAAAQGGVSSSNTEIDGSEPASASGDQDPGDGAWRIALGPQRHYLHPGALTVSDPDHAEAREQHLDGTAARGAASAGSSNAGAAPITVTVRAARGRLTLGTWREDGTVLLDSGDHTTTATGEGGSSSGGGGDGMDQPTLRFAAFGLAAANRALEGLGYRCDAAAFPAPNPGLDPARALPCGVGRDEITVHVDDNGFSGRGGPLTAVGMLTVWVAPAAGSENDNDPTTSWDEWAHGYHDSESGDSQWALDDVYDADASAVDMEYGDEADAAEEPSAVYPGGTLSWHDVHNNFGAEEDEPRSTRRMGNGDFWDE
jgi:ELWxxDGT repeat protein